MIQETKEYKRGYQNVVLDVQKQYNLRNGNVIINTNKDPIDQPSTSQPKEKASIKIFQRLLMKKYILQEFRKGRKMLKKLKKFNLLLIFKVKFPRLKFLFLLMNF